MTFGLADLGYSFPEGQAVKLIFFVPCINVSGLAGFMFLDIHSWLS